jgi:hypothetical protein
MELIIFETNEQKKGNHNYIFRQYLSLSSAACFGLFRGPSSGTRLVYKPKLVAVLAKNYSYV